MVGVEAGGAEGAAYEPGLVVSRLANPAADLAAAEAMSQMMAARGENRLALADEPDTQEAQEQIAVSKDFYSVSKAPGDR